MHKPEFLLINPLIHDFAAFDLWAKPLGFLFLYSFLEKKECGLQYIDCTRVTDKEAEQYNLSLPETRTYGTGKFYSAKIQKPDIYKNIPRNYRRYGKTPEIVRDLLRSCRTPDSIFVTSSMTYWYRGVQETIRLCMEEFPGIPVILGGTYATLCNEHAKAHSGASTVIAGNWENGLLPLLKNDFGISFTEEETQFKNLPAPANGLYPDSGTAVMRITRGCPFTCAYCASGILSPVLEARGTDTVVREIEQNIQSGPTDIALYDDALLVNAPGILIPVLEQVIKRKLKVRFHTPNGLHVRFMDDTIARLFRAAGFLTVRLSFESVRGRAKKASGGKAEPADLEHAVVSLCRAGYTPREIEVYMLIGLPGQEESCVRETAEFINSLGCIIKPAQYSPVPGTPLFTEQAARDPRIAEEPLLQNSTIAPGWDFDTARYDRIKQYIREFNRNARARIHCKMKN